MYRNSSLKLTNTMKLTNSLINKEKKIEKDKNLLLFDGKGFIKFIIYIFVIWQFTLVIFKK